MKTKLEKGLRYLAAGIFFMALLLNVKFTLDSPYFISGSELIAQTTGTGTDTGTGTGTGTGTDTRVKIYHCRKVDCKDTFDGYADVNGCVTIFGKKYCNFGVNAKVSFSYFGKKENCTGGSDWYDCNACQSDCVPN